MSYTQLAGGELLFIAHLHRFVPGELCEMDEPHTFGLRVSYNL